MIKEKDGKEVSYRWFRTKEKAEAFAMNILFTAVDLNTKAVEKMVNLSDARKCQNFSLEQKATVTIIPSVDVSV